jgi:hypothetical protein
MCRQSVKVVVVFFNAKSPKRMEHFLRVLCGEASLTAIPSTCDLTHQGWMATNQTKLNNYVMEFCCLFLLSGSKTKQRSRTKASYPPQNWKMFILNE